MKFEITIFLKDIDAYKLELADEKSLDSCGDDYINSAFSSFGFGDGSPVSDPAHVSVLNDEHLLRESGTAFNEWDQKYRRGNYNVYDSDFTLVNRGNYAVLYAAHSQALFAQSIHKNKNPNNLLNRFLIKQDIETWFLVKTQLLPKGVITNVDLCRNIVTYQFEAVYFDPFINYVEQIQKNREHPKFFIASLRVIENESALEFEY